MVLSVAAVVGTLFTKAGALAQQLAHFQKKVCNASLSEEQFMLLEVRSTMISCERANGGLHSQPYQWLHEILLPPTDAVIQDYLQTQTESEIGEEPALPGMFDDDPAVQGLFNDVMEAEPGFESSMHELDSSLRAEYDWPVGAQEAVVRLGQIVLPLVEVGNPSREGVVGSDILRERQHGPEGSSKPSEACVVIDNSPS